MPINLTTWNGRDRWRNVEETVNALAPSAGDATFESIDGDLVFKTSRLERGRIKADGTKTGVFGSLSYSVKDYGATGNGVTNDSVAIQAAVNAITAAGGGTLFFPPGTYLAANIVLPQSGITTSLLVLGYGATLKCSGGNPFFKRVAPDQTTALNTMIGAGQEWTFEGLSFVGTNTAGQFGAQIDATYKLRFVNCQFMNLDRAINVNFALGCNVLGCMFTNNLNYNIWAGFGAWTGASTAASPSNGFVERDNRHYCTTGMQAASHFEGSIVRLQDCIYEGGNPVNTIENYYNASTTTKNFSVSNLHIEHTPTNSIFALAVTGHVWIDQVWMQTNAIWVDTTFQTGCYGATTIDMTHCPWFPGGFIGKQSGAANDITWWLWRFANIDTNWNNSAYWSGAVLPQKLYVTTGNTLGFTGGVMSSIYNDDFTLVTKTNSLTTIESKESAGVRQLGFFGAAPVVQPVNTTDLRTALINLGLVASGGANPLNLNGGTLTAGAATVSGALSAGATTVTTATVSKALVETIVTLTYGASIATDASLGNEFTITATNNTAFTIANPTNPATGQIITYTLRNTSGGVLGAVTWDTLFKLAAWTSPATANSRSISFRYDGTNWVEINRTPADVPN